MAERLHTIYLHSEYLTGELPPVERRAVEVHLRVCAVCRQELRLLRQAVAALQELPLETTPADFIEKLNRRIDQEAGLCHGEEPVVREAVLATLARSVHSLGRVLFWPWYVQLPLYASVAVLALATLLLRASPEKTKAPLALPTTPAPLALGPLPQRMESGAGETMQPVGTVGPAAEKLLPALAASPSPIETRNAGQRLMWRVVGTELAILHQQVKVLVRQIAEALIVQEDELLLVISLPTQSLPALRQELSTLGEASTPETGVIPTTPTTLLHIKFVRSPSVVSPPHPEQPSNRS
jgi:hypothetical protein